MAAGHEIRPWYEHFPSALDIDWLPAIGQHGWVLLTKDRGIRRRPLEVEAILNARVRAFVLTATDLTREAQADVFVRAMQKIVRICEQRGPFIYNLTRTGQLAIVPRRLLRRHIGRKRNK
jgi:hypothetical protein